MRVEAKAIFKSYSGRTGDNIALNGVSLSISPGEMVVLLGPSGCGKTTLLRSIAGLVLPDDGEISIEGRVVYSAKKKLNVPPERRGISMVFQSYALWPHMTVGENIAYPLECRNVAPAAIRQRVEEVVAAVGLAGLSDRLPSQLSGGQQQRAALARAIAPESHVVLFDEPLSNVDAKVRDSIRAQITDLQRQLGFAGIYVTHDQIEAGALADRLVVMNHGTIEQIGTPSEIYDQPKSRYVAMFIGSANELTGKATSTMASGQVSVETEAGPIVGTLKGPTSAGQKVTVLFRPEKGRLTHAKPSDGENLKPGRIHRIIFMGAVAEVTMILGDGDGVKITAHVERNQFSEGDAVWFAVSPEAAWIFPE